MNNEQQLLIDEAYENYYTFMRDDRQWELDKEEFINKCKTDKEFSEKWGLTIEQRELKQFERVKLLQKAWKNNGITPEHEEVSTIWVEYKNLMEKYNIPTRIITLSYNNKTTTSYE